MGIEPLPPESEYLRERFIPYGTPAEEPPLADIDKMGPYPDNPLLSIEEVDEANIADLRATLPDTIREQLSDDEIVVRINNVNVSKRPTAPSAIKILMALTGVTNLADIGQNGPSVAALPGSENILDAAQRRFMACHIRDAILTAKLYRRTRDTNGLITERLRFPRLMRSTLIYAAEQGGIMDEVYDPTRPYRQEKPGKVMLVNFGPKSPGGRKFSRYLGWGHPIYTSVDANPLFISNLADYITHEEPDFLSEQYIARDGEEHLMGQFFDLAVNRLLADISESKMGFLEFRNLDPREGHGMINQAWADSAGAYVHADGRWANHDRGIAAAEVQGYAFDALTKAAGIYRNHFREPDKAMILEERASKLREEFLNNFFVTDDRGTYVAMGRDYDENGQGRNLEVRHANMGLLLETGILDGDDPDSVFRRKAIIETLFADDLVTRYGFRSLSDREAAYRPGGDHVGQIWPHINESIARGLIKDGYHRLTRFIRRANWLIYAESHALPEYIRGDSDISVKINTYEIFVWNKRYRRMYIFEIPGQTNQAWASAAVLAAKYHFESSDSSHTYDAPLSNFEERILTRLPGQDL
jgi:hypothetical protein